MATLLTIRENDNPHYPYHYMIWGTKLYCTNGWSFPVAWDGLNEYIETWGVPAAVAGAFAAAEGAAGNVENGDYWYRATFGLYLNGVMLLEGNPCGAISVTVAGGPSKVELSDIPQPDATIPAHLKKVTRVTIWRTRKNDYSSGSFYRVTDLAVGTTAYTDNTADDDLPLTDWMSWVGRTRGIALKYPYCAAYKGRGFMGGQILHDQGTVDAAAASTTLAGTLSYWRNIMAGTQAGGDQTGWTFLIDGIAKVHKIDSVTSATVCDLVEAPGTTVSDADYKVTGEYRSEIAWSHASQIEYWNGAAHERVGDEGRDYITGLFSTSGYLGITKETTIYQHVHTGDPAKGTITPTGCSRGALHQRVIVPVDDTIYMMDQFGMHQYAGGPDSTPISDQIKELIQPSDEDRRVNWTYRDKFHAIYDAKHRKVIWFLVMGDDTEPHDALCWHVDRQVWTWEHYEQALTASCSGLDVDGTYRVWVGDDQGWRWVYGVGYTDGADTDYTVRGTVTAGLPAGDLTSVYDSTASFPLAGDTTFTGVYVWKVSSHYGTTEKRRIVSSGATELTVTPDFDNGQTEGDKYYVGAIESTWESGWIDAEKFERLKRFSACTLVFSPQDDDFDITVNFYLDRSETAYSGFATTGDRRATDGYSIGRDSADVLVRMSHPDGEVRIPFGKFVRFVKIKVTYLDTNRYFELDALDFRFDAEMHET